MCIVIKLLKDNGYFIFIFIKRLVSRLEKFLSSQKNQTLEGKLLKNSFFKKKSKIVMCEIIQKR